MAASKERYDKTVISPAPHTRDQGPLKEGRNSFL